MVGVRLSVAPMEGITTFPMRLWLHWASAPSLMTTPFLKCTEVFPGRSVPEEFAPELGPLRGVLPYQLTPQLLAANPEHFLRGAELFDALSPVVEINCGCPSPNSAGKTAGSGALRDPEWFGRAIERLSLSLGARRLAVKMRVGVESADEFDALLAQVTGSALARLTIHGRTRFEGYRGASRWNLIGKAAQAAPFPVWGSGDVVDRETYVAARTAAEHVAGIMIGRGILRNPWLFLELSRDQVIRPDEATLADALLCHALVHEAWLRKPDKLLAKIASGKLSDHVGTDPAGWQKYAVILSTLVWGVPCVASTVATVPDARLSSATKTRAKLIRYEQDPDGGEHRRGLGIP